MNMNMRFLFHRITSYRIKKGITSKKREKKKKKNRRKMFIKFSQTCFYEFHFFCLLVVFVKFYKVSIAAPNYHKSA